MATGRPLVPFTIGAEQREQLQSWSRRAKTAQALALRARIVLLTADGLSDHFVVVFSKNVSPCEQRIQMTWGIG